MAYEVELTDTFGGDANYSWVRRAVIEAPDLNPIADFGSSFHTTKRMNMRREQAAIMRRAKLAVGMNGVRGVTTSFGDGYEFRPYGMCQVMFVKWCD